MSKLKITLVIILACCFTFACYIYRLNQHSVIFCDVGQGSATLFQVGSIQVLIDTGPDGRVLSCLGRYMPYFDTTIEVIVVSHDQKDHCGGLGPILNKYSVQKIYGPPQSKRIYELTRYTEIKDQLTFFFNQYIFTIKRSSQSSDKNESANVVSVFSPLNVYFISSDISAIELYKLMPKKTTVFEVPHHGSKYGLSPLSLSLAHPTLAVISVGKDNIYGHPSNTVLELLKAKKIPFMRTDLQGDIVLPIK